MGEVSSVLVDTSFCIRILKADDEFHREALNYFRYFVENEIPMFLSSIVVSEYSVLDSIDNLVDLNAFELIDFNYRDAVKSGEYLRLLSEDRGIYSYGSRKVVINDIKLFAQISNRKIDAFVTEDRKSYNNMIQPLEREGKLNITFIDLTVPIAENLGKLF